MPKPRVFEEMAFDRWLTTSLQQRHRIIVSEPLPEALVKLLQDDKPR